MATPTGQAMMPLAAQLVGVTALGVMLALIPANRLLTRLGLRRWRLVALFLPVIGIAVFVWLTAFGHADDPEGPGVWFNRAQDSATKRSRC